MKILIISDSHGNVRDFCEAVEKENPDFLFFLGDVERDFFYVRDLYPNLRVYAVAGNNDFFSSLNTHDTVTVGGKKIFYCHGHTFSVRQGTDVIKRVMQSAGCDIALFGHTHTPVTEQDGDRLIINPGAMHDGRYAVLETDGASVTPTLKRI